MSYFLYCVSFIFKLFLNEFLVDDEKKCFLHLHNCIISEPCQHSKYDIPSSTILLANLLSFIGIQKVCVKLP